MSKARKYEQRLMDALHFDVDDLEANREGRLSERQAANSARQGRQWLHLAVFASIIAGIALVGVSQSGLLTERGNNGLVVWVIGGLVILVALYIGEHRETRTVTEERAVVVEGRVKLDIHTVFRGRPEYRLRIEKTRFSVTKPAFLAFKNGDPYRIYYAPRSRRILSVEWLREDDHLILGE